MQLLKVLAFVAVMNAFAADVRAQFTTVDLRPYFDNDGISHRTNLADGNFNFNCSYPAEELPAPGPCVLGGLPFEFPDYVDGLAYEVAEDVPADLLVQLVITLKPNTRSAGILFRTTPELDRGYMVRLEPTLRRVVFDHWPKGWPRGRGEHSFTVQRPLNPTHFSWEKPITIQLLIDGTIAEVFVDNQVALVTRIYDHEDGDVALFVEYGEAGFEDITFKSLP